MNDFSQKELDFFYKNKKEIENLLLNEDKNVLGKIESFLNYGNDINSELYKGYAYKYFGEYGFRNRLWKNSLKNYLNALDYENIFSNDDIIDIYTKLGLIYYKYYDLSAMIEYYKKAFLLLKDDTSLEVYANLLVRMGLVYFEIKNYKESEELFIKAVKILENITTLNNLKFEVFYHLGNLYYRQNKYSLALETFVKVLSLAEKNEIFYAECSESIGNIYRKRKEYNIALVYYADAKMIYKKENDHRKMFSVYCNMMESYSQLLKFDVAQNYLEKAEEQLQFCMSLETIRILLYWKKSYYYLKGDYKKAYDIFWEYDETNAEAFKKSLEMNITQMKTLYDFEEKEKNNRLMEKKNNILSKKNKQLKETIHLLQTAQNDIIELEKKNAALATAVATNHELNQPLMILSGNLELLLLSLGKDNLKESQITYMKLIENSLNRIVDIIHNYGNANDVEFSKYSENSPYASFKEEKKK